MAELCDRNFRRRLKWIAFILVVVAIPALYTYARVTNANHALQDIEIREEYIAKKKVNLKNNDPNFRFEIDRQHNVFGADNGNEFLWPGEKGADAMFKRNHVSSLKHPPHTTTKKNLKEKSEASYREIDKNVLKNEGKDQSEGSDNDNNDFDEKMSIREIDEKLERRRKEYQREMGKVFENIKLKAKENEIPVAIVDQHQEVIPYWYKAVDEGIIPRTGNTLIHIDAHSDMAPPEISEFLLKLKMHDKMAEHEYLPFMQSNDEFILSAIFKGLIDRVIWIRPSWNDYSNETEIRSNFVGVLEVEGNNKKEPPKICDCTKRIYLKKKRKTNFECMVLNRTAMEEDGAEADDMEADIDVKRCKKTNSFKYFVISELKFERLLKFKKINNLFVDIDEDYFGVESGAQNLLDKGIPAKHQGDLDFIMEKLLCVVSVDDEIELNKIMKTLMKDVLKQKKGGMQLPVKKLEAMIERQAKKFICTGDHSGVNELAAFFNEIDSQVLKALSGTQFCMIYSPRLSMMTEEDSAYKFRLCTGNVQLNDTLNKIHIGSKEEILERSAKMESMLRFIGSHKIPKLYTLCRSLRDGYTPRHQQRFIEKNVLETIDRVVKSQGFEKKIIYDSQLSFGKDGWPDASWPETN